jgi:hypothetical protein
MGHLVWCHAALSNPGMIDVCPEFCIQIPDKVPSEVRPGFNCQFDLIPFLCNR